MTPVPKEEFSSEEELEFQEAERDYWGDSRNRFIQMQEEKHERDALSRLANATRKGLLRGRAEGRAEGKLEMVKRMLLNGLDIAEASKVTVQWANESELLKAWCG
jgi:predicted transposase YdaD